MKLLSNHEKIKELKNLLNAFEVCYPIIEKNIEKFEIENIKHKCYLSWFAGVIFFKKDIPKFKDLVLDYFFEKIYNSFNFKNFSEKGVLFAFFSLGGIVSINNYDSAKDLLKDYYKIIAVGIVLLQRLKFDYIEDGVRKWSYETISKYFSNESIVIDSNSLREFYKIIHEKDSNVHDRKILN